MNEAKINRKPLEIILLKLQVNYLVCTSKKMVWYTKAQVIVN